MIKFLLRKSPYWLDISYELTECNLNLKIEIEK